MKNLATLMAKQLSYNNLIMMIKIAAHDIDYGDDKEIPEGKLRKLLVACEMLLTKKIMGDQDVHEFINEMESDIQVLERLNQKQ